MATTKQLEDIATLLRRDVIEMTSSANSGHPTSCMSAAEIMATLFFDTLKWDITNPNNPQSDEFILSKGHCAPILYASLKRAGAISDNLNTLRSISSRLEGHPNPKSFPWVKVGTGSLGQGLSIGLGMALTTKKKVYVLMGDGELAEGSVYEALELASYYKINNLIAIADINKLGQSGPTMLAHDMKSYAKRFSAFGWSTIEVDGHSIPALQKAFKKAQKETKPTIILAKTQKGKGVSFLEGKEGWHGKALGEKTKAALDELDTPKMPQIKISSPKEERSKKESTKLSLTSTYQKGENVATRDAYGAAIKQVAKTKLNLLTTDAEVRESTRSAKVLEVAPTKFIDAYIAEQNMVGLALGASTKGKVVFASTFAAFFTRAHDQLRMAALSSGNLNFVGSHAGVSIGEDGVSQMGLEDLALFRSIPSSTVLYPSDATSTIRLVEQMCLKNGLKYLRLARAKTPVLYNSNEKFPMGEFKLLRNPPAAKTIIIAAGVTVSEALKAHDLLQRENIPTAIVDCYSIKPFPEKKLREFTKNAKKVIVVEDHYAQGGLGETVSSALSGLAIPITHLCVKEIPHSGTCEQLLKKYKIDSQAIFNAVKE